MEAREAPAVALLEFHGRGGDHGKSDVKNCQSAKMDDGWSGSHRLCNMTHLYGHFYKVLWKLLTKANGDNHPGKQRERPVGERRPGRPKKAGLALVCAGCKDGDGASTMAFNFASAFAAYSSRKVVLVDGNMRDPVLHRQFSAKSPRGLSDVIRGTTPLEEAILEIEPNRFSFLQAGGRVKSPVALFESPEFSILVEELRDSYDLVIFDSAPLISYPETTLLASATNGSGDGPSGRQNAMGGGKVGPARPGERSGNGYRRDP